MAIPLDQQNIINILGIESLPDERKAALVDQMTNLVQKRMLLRILDSLDEVKRSEFEKLLDQNDQAKLNEFIKDKVPQMADWLMEEVLKIKQEMADLAANA